MTTFEVSQRRACAVVEQPRSTQRLARVAPPAPERRLRARLRALAKAHPRYGYRRLHALLLREGFTVNHKRIQRLCRDEGLRVRVSRRERARVGTSTTPGIASRRCSRTMCGLPISRSTKPPTGEY